MFDDILLRLFGFSSVSILGLLGSDIFAEGLNSQLMLDDQDHCPSSELYSNFHTFPGDCFVFPPISAILGAFLTICFQPFAVLLFLAQCSAALLSNY